MPEIQAMGDGINMDLAVWYGRLVSVYLDNTCPVVTLDKLDQVTEQLEVPHIEYGWFLSHDSEFVYLSDNEFSNEPSIVINKRFILLIEQSKEIESSQGETVN